MCCIHMLAKEDVTFWTAGVLTSGNYPASSSSFSQKIPSWVRFPIHSRLIGAGWLKCQSIHDSSLASAVLYFVLLPSFYRKRCRHPLKGCPPFFFLSFLSLSFVFFFLFLRQVAWQPDYTGSCVDSTEATAQACMEDRNWTVQRSYSQWFHLHPWKSCPVR